MEIEGKDKMAKKDSYARKVVDVERSGQKIILPDDPAAMTLQQAIDALKRRQKEEETPVSINEFIEGVHYMDAARAFALALAERFGWADAKVVKSFFGDMPPNIVSVQTDYGKRENIIWGTFNLPGLDGGYLKSSATQLRKNGPTVFQIGGEVKRKYMHVVADIADRTRRIVKEDSIYRGKPVRYNMGDDPSFIDVSGPADIILPAVTEAALLTNLLAPIEYTEACRAAKIPLKRGILLEGTYGTGKTLASLMTAQRCRANGWTFVLCDKPSELSEALAFARVYQPAVVFCEDIDREAAGQERTVSIDALLNMIDGVESKGSEIITVLTTNDVESINKAMLRPGRLDAVVHMAPPDPEAVIRLIQLYGGNRLDPEANLKAIGKTLAGRIPAVIREVVERAKLHAIRLSEGQDATITSDALKEAADTMVAHWELLEKPAEQAKTPSDLVGEGLTGLVAEGVNGKLGKEVADLYSRVGEIHDCVC